MKIEQNIKLAVDAVVFGYQNSQLFVLLIQQKFNTAEIKWALPGGLVKESETLKEAVYRELKEETNVEINFLEQLYTFGDDIYRDHRNRVVSVAYFALVQSSKMTLKADTDAIHAEWVNIQEIPKLAFDHNQILEMALQRLNAKLTYQPIGFDLLPKEFLFSDLENLYTTILGKEIDRRNFRKKILSFGFVEETEKFSENNKGRPAKYFKFNQLKYNQLIKEGIYFDIHFA